MGVFVFLWKLGDKSNSEQNIIASVFFWGNITGVMLVVHCNVIKPSKHWRVEITTTIVFFFLGGESHLPTAANGMPGMFISRGSTPCFFLHFNVPGPISSKPFATNNPVKHKEIWGLKWPVRCVPVCDDLQIILSRQLNNWCLMDGKVDITSFYWAWFGIIQLKDCHSILIKLISSPFW